MSVVHVCEFETELGAMQAASLDGKLLALRLPGASDVCAWLRRVEPGAELVTDADANRPWIERVHSFVAGSPTALDGAPLDPRGTPFQRRVWEHLRGVPYGTTISYAELARRVESPRAVRAVGQANGANPLPLFVPCHRVVASGGELGGFGGGRRLKQRLLELEAGATSLFGDATR